MTDLTNTTIDGVSYPLVTELDPAGVYDLLVNHRGEYSEEVTAVQYLGLKHLSEGLTVCVDTVAEGVWGDPDSLELTGATARYFWMTTEQHELWKKM